MAASPVSSDGQLLTTRRQATHWLFTRLVGAEGVSIPDSALFDDEGVLIAWLHTTPLVTKPKQKHQRGKPAATPAGTATVVRSRDVLELSLLRLEAHFQDLARQQHASPSADAVVAVIHDGGTPHELNETALDGAVRALCARQRSMTAPEPDLSVARTYAGGRFVLQAATSGARCGTAGKWAPRDAITVITSFSADDDGAREAFAHEVQRRSNELDHTAGSCVDRNKSATLEQKEAEEEDEERRWRASIDWSGAFAQAEVQSRAVLRHLRAAHGLAETPTLTTARHRSHAFRVCRQCRTPVDVEIAHELLQQQTLVRDVLAKYQAMSARRVEAEAQCEAATERAAQCENQVVRLETEIVRLREQLAAQTERTREVVELKHDVELQLLEAEEHTQQAERQVQDATAQIAQLLVQQSNALQSVENDGERQQHAWREQDAQRDREPGALRHQLECLQSECALLQQELEEARAAGDQLRFQWAFVARKLTDVGDAGVLPPKRVAGGYSSYPTPTLANVEQVVKWIVDYEARRTVLDAQQRKQGSPGKTLTRRLQMKVELMRLLQKSSALSSPTRRRSTRRKSSRSPQRKTSSTRQPPEMETTLVRDRRERQATRVWETRGGGSGDEG